VVVLAGLINASKVVGKSISELSVVVNGAGAAGIAIARLLKGVGCLQEDEGVVVKDVIVCDTKGVIYKGRMDLTDDKEDLLRYTNVENKTGSVKDALVGADVFIGVSKGNLLHADDIATMADQAIIFALANPEPEIMPEEAYRGGAAVVATGRSDLPNQINNVLCFPGIFKGALEARASSITMSMKLAAAYAIAGAVENPAKEWIVPSALDASVALKVSEAVKEIALQTMLEMH
jgi:malate dehydrogenase (oxaloacetate-decarboxylating)